MPSETTLRIRATSEPFLSGVTVFSVLPLDQPIPSIGSMERKSG